MISLVCCILAAALHRGTSAQTICTILTHAISGLYVPQGGFVQCDLDITLLVKSIGGPHLLYALHGIPSWRTVGCNTKIPRLIATPTYDEIKANITAFFDTSVKSHPTCTPTGHLSGNIAMFDGIALKTKCRYCPKQD
jgi:hypothetical protein